MSFKNHKNYEELCKYRAFFELTPRKIGILGTE